MIELTLLGLHAARGPDGRETSSLPAQPKRFALLAYLAISGSEGYHRRDSLAAMFWPDLDQFAARRALRNMLYLLREAIGDDAFITQGDEALKIDPAVVTSDVSRLAAAVEDGRFEEAVDLYRGQLLAGIHFTNAGEAFEEWLSHERARVTSLVIRAANALTEREERAGNFPAAAHWAQRACVLAPDDEKRLRRAMSLLDDSDDRGGALRLYESYERRLATEFESSPTAETVALSARIRAGTSRRSARVAPTSAPVHGAPAHSTLAPDTRDSIAPPPRNPPSLGEAPRPAPARGTRPRVLWSLAIVAAAAVIVFLARGSRPSHAAPAARTRVLVDVFDNRTGDPTSVTLGRMAEDWLVQGLSRLQSVDVVDPRTVFVQGHAADGTAVDPLTIARRTGATMVVSGSYYRTGDSVLFQASVTDARAGRIIRVVGPIGASAQAPLGALDQLRSRVMTALVSQLDQTGPAITIGDDEIPPFEAYQPYVQGWDAYWHGDHARATALFLDAARRDPAFTNAAVAAASVESNVGGCSVVDSIARALTSALRSLSRIQQLTLQIGVAHCHGRNDEMLRLTLERAELEPGTSSARSAAAAAALFANRPRRALQMLETIDPGTDLSWSTDSSHFEYWSPRTEALHLLGRHAEELDVATRMPSVAPPTRAWLRGRALAATGGGAELLALVDTILTMQTETSNNVGLAPFTTGRPQYTATPAWIAVWIARECAVNGDTATSRQIAARATEWYRDRAPDERSTTEERLVEVWALDLMGSYAEAERGARALMGEDSTNIDFRGMLAGIAAERGDSALTDSIDSWLSHQNGDAVAWTASYYRARDAALLGHRATALALLHQTFDEGVWPMWVHIDPAFTLLAKDPDYIALMAPRG